MLSLVGRAAITREVLDRSTARAANSTPTLALLRSYAHPFSTSPLRWGPKPLPPRPVINDADLIESFLKGTGPGGQKINKTNSSVQLKHIPTGIVVKCQATRSRAQNRSIARRLLQDRIEELEMGDGARTNVKRRLEAEKKERAERKRRAKYRAREDGKGEEEEKAVDEREKEGQRSGEDEIVRLHRQRVERQMREAAELREELAREQAAKGKRP